MREPGEPSYLTSMFKKPPLHRRRGVLICLIPVFILLASASAAPFAETAEENRVLSVVQKMESTFASIEDYSCRVEQIFYQSGVEDPRYRFEFYFKRKKKIRVDFSEPHNGLRIFYDSEEDRVTAMPFRLFPFLTFHFSAGDPTLRTPSGQRINQTDMGYFIEFLLENLKKIEQKDVQYKDERGRIEFSLWAKDYVRGKVLERYRIYITKENWLPTRIERYSLEGKLLELTMIRDYRINTHVEDRFFRP